MKNKIKENLYLLRKHQYTRQIASSLIILLSRFFLVDLRMLSYHKDGINNFKNLHESGESFFVSKWLRNFLNIHNVKQPCFFDVGANIGEYSKLLFSNYPASNIYAFEPNPYTFLQLNNIYINNPNIRTLNIALGSRNGTTDFYLRQDNTSSKHATLYKEVLREIHLYNDVQNVTVSMETLDNFCLYNHIEYIDFLKIDTEGYELEVLRGSNDTLNGGNIGCIQFEFNEMNIFSRVFLKDFVELLSSYNLYRLLPSSLLPIHYSSKEEIFLFQNILAVKKDLDLTGKVIA